MREPGSRPAEPQRHKILTDISALARLKAPEVPPEAQEWAILCGVPQGVKMPPELGGMSAFFARHVAWRTRPE